jgi:hypothetical protein
VNPDNVEWFGPYTIGYCKTSRTSSTVPKTSRQQRFAKYKAKHFYPSDPDAVVIAEECAANCDVVIKCTHPYLARIVNAILVAFSISTHFMSIYPLYDKYTIPATVQQQLHPSS